MIIDISKLVKGIEDEIRVSFEEEIKVIEFNKRKILFNRPIKVNGKFITDGKIIIFKGTYEIYVDAVCDRCGESYECNMSNDDISETFINGSIQGDEELYHSYINSKVDFEPVIRQYLVLNMPMKFLCSDDCKGICHKCGKNLNKEQCTCEKTNEFSPFADLKGMFDK